MEEAYREYVTTSPSYHLLASRGRRGAHARGAGRAGARRARSRAPASSRRRCASALPDLDHLDDPAWLGAFAEHVARQRPRQDDARALALRALRLRRRRRSWSSAAIVIEKAGVQHDHADHDVPARRRRGGGRRWPRSTSPRGPRAAGRRAAAAARQPVPRDRRPARHAPLRRAPLRQVDRPRGAAARGRRHVAAESIEVYPPGMPLMLEGFRVSADAVDYLLAGARRGRLDRRARHVAWRRCASCSAASRVACTR